jgi:hypothetical protein
MEFTLHRNPAIVGYLVRSFGVQLALIVKREPLVINLGLANKPEHQLQLFKMPETHYISTQRVRDHRGLHVVDLDVATLALEVSIADAVATNT